jgi:hypothetical protein
MVFVDTVASQDPSASWGCAAERWEWPGSLTTEELLFHLWTPATGCLSQERDMDLCVWAIFGSLHRTGVGWVRYSWPWLWFEHCMLRFAIMKPFNVINHTIMWFGKAKFYQIEYKSIDHKGMIHQIFLISRNFIFPNDIFRKAISLIGGVAQCETTC